MTIDREVLGLFASVLVAIITASGGGIIALIQLAGKLRQIAADASASRAQVENSHRTNLRADIDEVSRTVRDLRDHLRDIRAAATAEHEALWAAITKGRQGDLPTGSIPTNTDPESKP